MEEHNAAIRLAQRVLEGVSRTIPATVTNPGTNISVVNPEVRAYLTAAELLNTLIKEENND